MVLWLLYTIYCGNPLPHHHMVLQYLLKRLSPSFLEGPGYILGKTGPNMFTFLYVDDLKIYEAEEKVVQLPPSSCYCLATIAAYLDFATDVELAQCSGGPRACAICMSS